MQFDDIKKQLPFTVSDADSEYLGLVATYLKNPADATLREFALSLKVGVNA